MTNNAPPAQQKWARRLAERQAQGLARKRRIVTGPQQTRMVVDDRQVISFCGNDYLALANHPKVKSAMTTAAAEYGAGAGAAHLVSGHTRAHHLLEEELADFTGRERALLFSTGYMANVGVLQALADRGDVIYQDKLNHASLLDGGLLSRAKMKRYRHGDPADLRRRLDTEQAAHGLVATDGVFSMEGDIAPLREIAAAAAAKGYTAMVDDAHGFGVLGDQGRGTVAAAGLGERQIPVYMATLGKAAGTFGAFVAGSKELIETLIHFARGYIYTTATPPAVAAAARAALKIIRQDDARRAKLHDNIRHFRQCATELALAIGGGDTAIQPIKVADNQTAVAMQEAMLQAGYYLFAARPPTVPAPCLRITLSSAHEHDEIEAMLTALTKALPHLTAGMPGATTADADVHV